jgi:hypothetical protein
MGRWRNDAIAAPAGHGPVPARRLEVMATGREQRDCLACQGIELKELEKTGKEIEV